MINQIKTEIPENQLKNELILKGIEVGMAEFTLKEDLIPIPKAFEKIGNFELDILAIELSTNEIVMLDHDQPDFIMGKVARNLTQFVKALKPIEKFIEVSTEDDNLIDDEEAIKMVTSKSSLIAGSNECLWFYNMIFGV